MAFSSFCMSNKGYGSMAQGVKKTFQKSLDRSLNRTMTIPDPMVIFLLSRWKMLSYRSLL